MAPDRRAGVPRLETPCHFLAGASELRYMKNCTHPNCTRPTHGRGLCITHYIAARRAGTLSVALTRARVSPPHLISGTPEYAAWWKAHNRERHLAGKSRYNANRRTAHLASEEYRARQLALIDRDLAVVARTAAGATAEQIASELGVTRHAVNSRRARLDCRAINRKMPGTNNARRELQLALATPKWVDQPAVLAIYAEAERRGESVDHIIPIRGKLVCGLHVPWNLRIIPTADNSRKGNRLHEHEDLL